MRWTRALARRELLRRVLEAHEESRSFWSPGSWDEDAVVPLEPTAFPEAFTADGRTLRACFAEAAGDLEREGVVRVVRGRGREARVPRALRLGSSEVAAAMVAAGDAGLERLGEVLEEFAEAVARLKVGTPLPDWMTSFLGRVAAGAEAADLEPLGMTRTAFKRARPDVLDALTAAALISGGTKGPERLVSQKVLGDPRRLGVLRSRVAEVLRRADPRWEASDPVAAAEVLAAYGVRGAARKR